MASRTQYMHDKFKEKEDVNEHQTEENKQVDEHSEVKITLFDINSLISKLYFID